METEATTLCGLKREDFQKDINGKKTDLYILRNSEGLEVAITNYGGAIVAIMVPDRDGNVANVIQGHDNIEDCINSPEPFLSTLVGRYGNRICKGRFVMNGKEYHLSVNNGPNHLHGGPTGFHARVWDAEQIDAQTLVLRYVSAYYEEGFPGELTMVVRYSFTDDNELVIDYIERLRPDLVLERFVSQSPKHLLIAPDWGLKNHEFTDRLKARMRERQTWQGKLYKLKSAE